MRKPQFSIFKLFILTGIIFSGTICSFGQNDNFIGITRPVLENQQSLMKSTQVDSSEVEMTEAGEAAAQSEESAAKENDSSDTKSKFKTCALLFAIDNYPEKTGLNPLNGCNNDIMLMYNWLTKQGNSSERISVLSDNQKKFPDALAPTDENFHQAMESLINKECDRLIVVCACHGKSIKNKSFLCSLDTEPITIDEFKSDEDPLEFGKGKHLISIDDILNQLKTSKAKEVLLILDACRDGGKGNFMTEFEDLLKEENQSKIEKADSCFAIITSCSFGQTAHEISAKPHGAFIYHFMDGLNSRKADLMGCNDGKISLIEAYNYAYSSVTHEFKDQTPEIFMSANNINICMIEYNMTADPQMIKKLETPLQFLLQTGIILCNNKWKDQFNEIGVNALNVVLENSPNNFQAYAVRGSAYRALGKYDLALLDMAKIDQKMQLYAKKKNEDESIVLIKKPSDPKTLDVKIKENDVLTITKANGDFFCVSEINNKSLGDKEGWIDRNNLHWNVNLSSGRTVATESQNARSVSYSGGGSSIHNGVSTGGAVHGGIGPITSGM